MTDKDIEYKLKKAVEDATPDVLDNILCQCNEKSGKVMTMKNNVNRNRFRVFASIAAAFVVVVGLVLGYNIFSKNSKASSVCSTITFDVNPSLEISVNSKERVLDVKPLNQEAEIVLEDMDFKDSDLDNVVNIIIGSTVKKGYINKLANSILISVDSKDTAAGMKLETKLSNDVEKLLETDSFNGAVLSQTVKHDDTLESNAEKYGITVGKAQLISRIIAADNRYTFEQLAGLTINELNLLSSSGQKIASSVGSKGTASDGKYIGAAKAKQIALEHIGLTEADISGFDCELDFENGKMVYEIEFRVGNMEYEYDISAVDGVIVNSQKDIDDDRDDVYDENIASAPESGYIGLDKAKSVALEHAGVKADEVRGLEAELDRDDGVYEYHVEFKYGGYEYDYEINPKTGAIIKSEKDRDD